MISIYNDLISFSFYCSVIKKQYLYRKSTNEFSNQFKLIKNKKMKTKKTMSKLVATAALAVAALTPSFAQNNLGESCGCPNVSARSTSINIGTYADVNGNLTVANLILTCDKMWVLDKKIFVGDGQTITINPGTVVKGAAGTGVNATALIISKGGKIFATGTESCPIVFTAAADPMDGTYGISNRGGWGGVIVLGKAKNNQAAAGTLSTGTAGVAFIEGFVSSEPRIQFGMPVGTEVDDDNSGIMTYVSIRHGGAIVGAANEINGLTLGSVGRGTTLHHIEVVSNLDDGIEFFGGTVDLKYGSVLFNDDDGFDWDLGWSGKGQFWSIVKTDQGTSSGGDNGFESDGDDSKGGGAFQSNPTVYNATYLGSNNINGSAVQKGVGLMAKEQSQGTIRNCVIANYQVALDLKDDATRPAGVDCYDNWIAGSLKIECNTFVANTHGLRINGCLLYTSDAADE